MDHPTSYLVPLTDGQYDLSFASGETIYSGDPHGMTVRFWQGKKLDHPTLLVFYGMDLGYHLRFYLDNPHKSNRAILVIEKSLEVFRHSLTIQDWTKELANPMITWMIGLEGEQVRTAFNNYFLVAQNLCYSACMESVMWSPSLEWDDPYYVKTAEILKKASETMMPRVTCPPEDNYYGLRNMLGNMLPLAKTPFLDSLQGIFAGRPGIAISSGPSLDQSLPYLHEVQNKAVLIAAESSVRTLLQAGIVPHFITCLERFVATKQIIGDLPQLADTWLVTLPIVYPGTITGYHGPQLFLCSRGTHYEWLLGNIPNHYLGPSVANMSYVILDILGCNPIFLLGQDLAYGRKFGRSHAKATLDFLQEIGSHEEKEALGEGDDNWVTGNDGQPILSSRFYRRTAHCFEDIVRESDKQCFNVIFPEYGMRLAETISQISPVDLQQYCYESVDVASRVRSQLNKKSILANATGVQLARLRHIQGNLASFGRRMLREMRMLSDFCFKHPPDLVPIDPVFSSEYRQEFDRLERVCLEYTQENFISDFFWPFQSVIHIKCFANYYALSKSEMTFEKQTIYIPQLFQKWFQENYLWASRANELLAEYAGEEYEFS